MPASNNQIEGFTMPDVSRLVVFILDQRRYGVPLGNVERIVQVVEVVPVPQAPSVVLGVINVHGLIVPVFNLRERLGLPAHEMQISDQFIIARTQSRTVALLADEVTGVEDVELPAADVSAAGFVEGVVQNHDALVFICDIERFLSGEEQVMLNASLSAVRMSDE